MNEEIERKKNNINNNKNEINCIYIPNKNEIYLLNDYNLNINIFKKEFLKEEYLEAKNMNTKLFEENIDLYINDEKIKFDFKYKIKD